TRRALGAGVLVGFAHAVLLHTTDMTEPAMATPFAVASLLILARGGERPSARWGAGALIGLSTAFYETFLSTALPGAFLIFPRAREKTEPAGRALTWAIQLGATALGTFALLGVSANLVYAPSRGVAEAVRRVVFVPTAAGLFGSGFDPRHLVGAWFGFAH